MTDVDGDEAPCSCKLGRNVARYGLRDLDERLRERHVDGASLRDLEGVVNRAILRGALRAAEADVLGDVDAVYEALTGDDVSAGRRTETRERLARAGVAVDDLEDHFVSYQTVRSHLRDCLDVDTTRERDLTVADGRGTIEWARSRSEGIVERTVERLDRADEIDAGDVTVTGTVRVTCEDCGVSAAVDAFLDRGGCDCSTDDGG